MSGDPNIHVGILHRVSTGNALRRFAEIRKFCRCGRYLLRADSCIYGRFVDVLYGGRAYPVLSVMRVETSGSAIL
jgi:hypothetical protein